MSEDASSIDQITQREAEFSNRQYAKFKLRTIEEPSIYGRYGQDLLGPVAGKKVLVTACAWGAEALLFKRSGADVYGIDLSEEGIAYMTRFLEHNNCSGVNLAVRNIYEMGFPDDHFDLVFGTMILHHVDVGQAMTEVHRVLKPGGMAVYHENSLRNPVLSFARNVLFPANEVGGKHQKGRFGTRRRGTDDENPIDEEEVRIMSAVFNGRLERKYPEFNFFQLGGAFGPAFMRGKIRKLLRGMDSAVYLCLPFLRRYSFEQMLIFTKDDQA